MANSLKDFENAIRNEKRRFKRAAYHEVGHALAMYLCYGNIKRIKYIEINYDGSGLCEHESKMNDYDYINFIKSSNTNGNVFKEICYCVGGGLCEAMYCNKRTEAILCSTRYKFPIKGMEKDLQDISNILSIIGITNQKDVDALIRVAVLRLKWDFYNYANQIKQCVKMIEQGEGFINRKDLNKIFRSKQ